MLDYKTYKIIILAILSGILIPLSLSPFNYSYLSFISIILLLIITYKAQFRTALSIALVYSCSVYLFGNYWVYLSIHQYGNTDIILSLLLSLPIILTLITYMVIKLLLLKTFQNYCSNDYINLLIFFPSTWVVIDWIQGLLFSGFPWLYIGYSLTDTILSSYAPLISVFGLSYLVIFISGLIYLLTPQVINNPMHIKTVLNLLLIAIIFSSCLYLNKVEWTKQDDNKLNLTIIQGNVSAEEKWNKEKSDVNLAIYNKLSENYWAENNTIIWPETAIVPPQIFMKDILNNLEQKAIETKSTLILGAPRKSEITINNRNKYYNTIVSLGKSEQARNIYYKKKLVPWGEYIPYENIFRNSIPFFSLPMTDYISGNYYSTEHQVLKTKNNTWVPFVCYEIIFPKDVIEASKLGTSILVLSNDDWLADSIAPWQHLQIAQMRAIETARYLVRSTNNGVTAVISPKGKIINQLPQFKRDILQSYIYPVNGLTPIMYYGTNSIIAFCFVLLFFCVCYLVTTRPYFTLALGRVRGY